MSLFQRLHREWRWDLLSWEDQTMYLFVLKTEYFKPSSNIFRWILVPQPRKKQLFQLLACCVLLLMWKKKCFSLYGKITIKTRMALHNLVCNLKLNSHIRTEVISIFPSLLPYSNTAAKQMSNTTWAEWTLENKCVAISPSLE